MNESLFKSKPFWWFLLTPLVLGLLIMASLTIVNIDSLSFEWSGPGLSNWARNFAVPLTIMGLSGPFTAIYIAHHRSIHQEQVIALQGQQNRVSNYYAAFDHFNGEYADFKNNETFMNIWKNWQIDARKLFSNTWNKNPDFELVVSKNILTLSQASKNLERELLKIQQCTLDEENIDPAIAIDLLRNYLNLVFSGTFANKLIEKPPSNLINPIKFAIYITDFLAEQVAFHSNESITQLDFTMVQNNLGEAFLQTLIYSFLHSDNQGNTYQ